MAITSAVFSPAETATQASLNTVTSTAEIVLGTHRLFELNADQDITIKFGNAGMGAAAATDYRIPANTIKQFVMPQSVDRIRLFNLSGSTAKYYIQPLTAQG